MRTPWDIAGGSLFLLLALGCAGEEETTPPTPAGTIEEPNPIRLDDWPSFRGQAELTGLAGGVLPADLHLKWSTPTGAPTLSSPVIADGRVYVGNDDGNLFALALEDGTEVWRTPLGEPDDRPIIEAPPLVAEGNVYLGDHYGALWCVAAADGAVRWNFTTEGKIVGSATVVGSGADVRILVGSHDAFLYCLDAAGKKLWEYEGDSFFNGMPAVSDGRAVFGGCDAFLHVVDVESGEGIARWDVGSYVASSVAIADGTAYLGHMEGRVLGIDLASGARMWEYGSGDLAYYSSAAVDATRVIIGGRDKRVHCIDRATGKARWTFRTNDDVDGSPVLCGDRVVATSADGRVYVLDIETGEKIWSYEIGAAITSSPAVAGGLVVVSALDGVIYAFGAR